MTMFIRSERLFLRPIWPEDWADLQAGLDDDDIVRNLSRMGWPHTPDKAREASVPPHNPRLPNFLITCPRGNQGVDVIGGIGLADLDGEVALGCWIARGHRGQGHATEAARAVLTLARTLGHHRVTARHVVDNPASGRVLRKLGFAPTGVAGACLTYALDLGAPSDCDDDFDGDGMGGDGVGRGGFPTRRAA